VYNELKILRISNKENYGDVYAMSNSLTSKIGGTNKENYGDVSDMNSDSYYRSFGRDDSMGLIGLENLENTCFMNNSIHKGEMILADDTCKILEILADDTLARNDSVIVDTCHVSLNAPIFYTQLFLKQ
jgi:ubiquitin C-terminal hydrolase